MSRVGAQGAPTSLGVDTASVGGRNQDQEHGTLPTLTVVVPVYNAGLALDVQLAALCEQQYPADWEVVVVDNGSTDGSGERAGRFASRFPKLQVARATAGAGPAYARNVGASLARGDAIVFVDQDDQVAPGYLHAMGRTLAAYRMVGARVDHDALNPPLLRAARFPWQSNDLMRGGFLPATSGCAMGIKRDVFYDLGGFDERFLYAQDIEFSWRAQLAGVELVFVPDAVLRYRYRREISKHIHQEFLWGTDDAFIYRTFRFSGMAPRTFRQSLSEWRQIFRATLTIRGTGDLLRVVSQSARRIGHLKGSMMHRVWFP